MPAETNVVTTNTTGQGYVREIDFATRFAKDINLLKEILGNVRLEKKLPGEVIKAKKASVTLNSTPVGEGEVIPYNAVTYSDVEVGVINYDKQKIGVTLEDIQRHGYENAVQLADDDLIAKMEGKIVKNFVDFMKNGGLTTTETLTDFQSALAEAEGLVITKWEQMDKGFSDVIAFANTQDVYRFLGAKDITMQSQFGMNYVENFLGCKKVFLSAKIPSKTILATASNNIVMNYIDVLATDFTKAGFKFTTDGERNLIGVHVEGNNGTMVSDLTALSGIGIWAEYVDGIAKVTWTDAT